ncbi:SAM-dependent methyltransferase [Janibacter cremeus]|uniref:Cyclopropane-fatty-acyl-phospholipid synthase n=1 Tax=Janibacter cremeus TaxID=1285192 RepID=A0A852VR02_9MICO|nr:cyclopropane-fatty-acyl-phospholipid synthase family protein [Janibacter cremeus]NYF98369.1 cyclopropane-fatty-acyl-phospholipid synthase [Janibacter cremeus]
MSRIAIAEALASFVPEELPVHITAYDGSSAGPPDAPFAMDLRTERGLSYLLTAPGDLGVARAYIMGDLVATGFHPGDPYPLMNAMRNQERWNLPGPREALELVRGLGWRHLDPPPVPPQETLPRWRRVFEGLRHSKQRDSEAISHHYDVSNRFYELVLGPSMTYTCALFPTVETSLEEAQFAKYDLIARKLDLQPGQRLLDVGCGWGGMVMHAAREYGVKSLGVTLSRAQADWAKEAIDRAGLGDLAEVRFMDYRDVPEGDFDAVSSIGLTEHIGVRNYPAYFAALRDKLRPGGRLLNHCITRPDNRRVETGAFIDRYVFPDGELTGMGTVLAEAQDVGLEVQHAENLRPHYAMTLAGWNRNLEAHWDEAVAEVGEGTARVWGLYMTGSRVAFERDEIELSHVLATRTDAKGVSSYPLRHTF